MLLPSTINVKVLLHFLSWFYTYQLSSLKVYKLRFRCHLSTLYSKSSRIRHRGNTSFDVTVTGQWSSPSGCVILRSISSLRSVFCFVLRSKISLILLVIGEFDVLKWVFNTQAMFVKNSGTGESFCVE